MFSHLLMIHTVMILAVILQNWSAVWYGCLRLTSLRKPVPLHQRVSVSSPVSAGQCQFPSISRSVPVPLHQRVSDSSPVSAGQCQFPCISGSVPVPLHQRVSASSPASAGQCHKFALPSLASAVLVYDTFAPTWLNYL